MKIGILLADDLRDGLQPVFGCYNRMFERLLAGNGFAFSVFDVRAGEYPREAGDCDAYLLTGSRHGAYEPLPWLPPLFEWIRRLHDERVPLLGVCFGHQATALALGGRVEKSTKGWGLGRQCWRVLTPAAWMTPPLPELRLLASHQDQVTALPPGAVRRAESDFCPNAAFSLGSHVFCLQGHPEFSPEFMLALLEYRRDDLPEEEIQRIAAGVWDENDGRICADWMAAFFKQGGAAAD